QAYNVSHEDRGWYGHSLAGLFGVYLLLNNDGLFKRFVICSPSLWWDNKVIFSMVEGKKESLPAKAFFSVGMLEGDSTHPMIEDLRELVEKLMERGDHSFEFTAEFIENETHLSVIPISFSRGLRYVYSK